MTGLDITMHYAARRGGVGGSNAQGGPRVGVADGSGDVRSLTHLLRVDGDAIDCHPGHPSVGRLERLSGGAGIPRSIRVEAL